MNVVVLLGMALIFLAAAAVFTAVESALSFISHHDAEAVLHESDPGTIQRQRALRKVLANPIPYANALRFWRIWFEMATAVALAVLCLSLIPVIWLAGLIATVVMAAVGFVLVGVSPRRFGRAYPLPILRATAGLVWFLCAALGPIPEWLIAVGNAVAPTALSGERTIASEEEFRDFVERASESELIEDEDAEIIQSVFELDDTLVRAVMVPRTDIVSIDHEATIDEALTLFIDSGYSRVPVLGESSDDVLGILYLKDVVAAEHQPTVDPAPALSVQKLAREARYVPESKPVGDLLRELQRESTHVAIVIDEYGGTAGLVTLEDLIEEIVGEIVDEYDAATPDVQILPDGGFRVSAKMSVEDLGELFDQDLDDDEVDTVGGLLAKHLGRVPIVGSSVEVEGIRLVADRLEGRRNRVGQMIAHRVEPVGAGVPLAEAEDPPSDGGPENSGSSTGPSMASTPEHPTDSPTVKEKHHGR
ncbi:hemolysin family protein [Psychromicrobium xiongbiense]|uniref:hemolysin family protein n=1 Tax=Psychromicrobium xiongbiense TaxID=3051184 RepID=UPI0025578167|nr:hemolysin family protein [Psychromicrobium sp. YIM S02556]